MIVADDKDWTWVLDRACPDRGFDASVCAAEPIPGLTRENANAWRVLKRRRNVVALVSGLVLVVVIGIASFESSRSDTSQISAEGRHREGIELTNTAASSADLPAEPQDLDVPGIPRDQALLRTVAQDGLRGERVIVKWFGTESFGPRYTTGLTVGDGAGARWSAEGDEIARDLSAAAAYGGREVQPVDVVEVNGSPGLLYTDMNGWVSTSWSPRADVLLSVTGWEVPRSEILALAEGVEVR